MNSEFVFVTTTLINRYIFYEYKKLKNLACKTVRRE